MHLLMTQIGEGGFFSADKGNATPLNEASFLPLDTRISVRPRSGIETMAAGYQFRFGADTKFTLENGTIHLHEGSLMIQSRNIGNQVGLNSPEAEINISGIGTCMLEVETNGGIKLIGVLGRTLVELANNKNGFELLSGELIFVKPGNAGVGDKINVNLGKVVETSFLLSGFKNNQSFELSLNSVVKAQMESIGKTYRAEVGDAKGVDTFEVVTVEEEEIEPENASSENEAQTADRIQSSYQVPEVDPLSELLGRSPSRMSQQNMSNSPEKEEPRPLPGSLLRQKK